MGNKLRDIFLSENKKDLYTITFSNSASGFEFFEQLKDGDVHEAHDIKGIAHLITDGSNKYPIEKSDNPQKVIAQKIENYRINIKTSKGEKIILFRKKKIIDGDLFTSDKNSILEYEIAFNHTLHKMNFKYTFHPENAVSISEISEAFEATYLLLKKLTSTEDGLTEAKNFLDVLLYESLYFEFLNAVNQELSLDISPKDVNKYYDDEVLISKLYFMLCAKEPLRENKIIHSVKVEKYSGELKEGSRINPLFGNIWEFSIGDKTINVFQLMILFNLIVDHVIEGGEETEVIFTDREESPAYAAVLGFLDQEQVEVRAEKFPEDANLYKDAKTLDQLILESMQKKEESLNDLQN